MVKTPKAVSKVKSDLTHIVELFLQDLNPSEHSNTGLTGARELMRPTLAGPCNFKQLGPGLCQFRMTSATIPYWTLLCQAPSWVCKHTKLKTSSIRLLGERGGAALEIPQCSPYLLQVKPFLFPLWLGCVFWLHIHQEANPGSGYHSFSFCWLLSFWVVSTSGFIFPSEVLRQALPHLIRWWGLFLNS